MNENMIRRRRHHGAITQQSISAITIAVLCMLWSAGSRLEAAHSLSVDTSGAKHAPSKDERMEWWREARFGMFIHWGLYAVPAGQWKGKLIPGLGAWIMNRAKIPVKA